MEASIQVESFFDDGHQDIDRDCNPDLGFDRVFGGAIECVDAQMLFDPTEEELHLPTAAIQIGDRLSRQQKVVG